MMKNTGIKQLLAIIAMSTGLLFPFALATAQVRQDNLLIDGYPDTYVVVKGDTLWDISGVFLEDPFRWPEIWDLNDQVANPHLIYPGDVLSLVFVEGSPRITVDRNGVTVAGRSSTGNQGSTATTRRSRVLPPLADGRRTVKLSPRIRTQTLPGAISAIPLEAIESSFTKNRIVSPEQYENSPYIVANMTNSLAVATGDEVYARGDWPAGIGSFEIYRVGDEFLSVNGEEAIGIELIYMGFATIIEEPSSDIRQMLINSSSRGIQVGDRLLIREESRLQATLFPTPPADDLEGSIVALLDGVSMAAQFDTVVLDLGLQDNLVVGDVLTIEQEGESIIDEVAREKMSSGRRFRNSFAEERLQLPGKKTGTVMVYKIFERFSYGVILAQTSPAKLYDKVTSR